MSTDPQPNPPTSRSLYPMLGGVVLIGIGIIFLLRNFNLLQLDFKWWALFILIPAVGAFAAAWNTYRQSGNFNRKVRSGIVGGLTLVIVAAIFLLSLDWGKVWPVFIILAGVGALFMANAEEPM